MGKRGPQPAQSLQAVDIKPQERINPPEGMIKRDRDLFRRIVAKMPAKHFTAADVPMLREYCEAAGRSKDAEKLIREKGLLVPAGPGTEKANPAVSIRTAAAAIMAQMAVKLRLCPSARSSAGGQRDKVEPEDKPKSARSGLRYGS